MKIAIIGYSGAGKSTLAKRLSKIYNSQCLYLDAVNFCENWGERSVDEGNETVKEFMKKSRG